MEPLQEWYIEKSYALRHYDVITLQSTASVTITVLDVNDNTPQCDQALFSFATDEANRLRIELGSVTATDGDAVAGLAPVGSGELMYSIASTNLPNVITVSSRVSSSPPH